MEHTIPMEHTTLPLTRCIHGAKNSPCNAACPFEMDIRAIINKVKTGNFNSAYGLYREAVVFPALAWRLCPAPCSSACRKMLGADAVDILGLERSLYENSKHRTPVNYNSPRQNKQVAVVGATLRGMTAALKLAQAGYDVTVFEKEDRICSHLESLLSRDLFEEAILSQFQYAKCNYVFHADYSKSYEAFQAVVIATTELPESGEERFFYLPEPGIAVKQIPVGKLGAKQADWFLKTGNRKESEELKNSEFVDTAENGVGGTPERKMGNTNWLQEGSFYTKAEARKAASSCTGCDCSACLNECVLMRDYGYDVMDLSRAVGLSLNLFKHAEKREGTRQIGGCNNCGLCEKICPEKINIGQVLLSARTELFAQGDIPPAYHDFWVRDLAFADSEQAALFYLPEKQQAKYLFFPGCQAGASDPRYVTMTYEKLRSGHPDTGLLLYCCGAPLFWEGDAVGMKAEHEVIRGYWKQAGRPEVLVSCPSCYRMFREYMPEIPVRMIYEVLEVQPQMDISLKKAAVFDPCSSRNYPGMQHAVRAIAAGCGVELEELKYHGEKSQCCSWGGQAYSVNRTVVDKQAEEQMEMSSLPYITYCTNCHDIFVSRGKECRHILDLILGINPEGRKVPDLRARRVNRNLLKKELVETLQIPITVPDIGEILPMKMEEKVLERMNRDLILLDDISETIKESEDTGYYLLDAELEHRIAHLKRGLITYWVEYQSEDNGIYTVYNAYSHRMTIKNDVVRAQIGEFRETVPED